MVNEIEQPGQTPGRHTSVPFAPSSKGRRRQSSVCGLSLFRDADGSEQGALAQVAWRGSGRHT